MQAPSIYRSNTRINMIRAHFKSFDDARSHIGKEVAISEWQLIDQARVDEFARATGDFQWIHVDPERARRESPFGGTIAHGYLTLSLLAMFAQNTITCEGVRMGLNYGLNRVRFTAPVLVGSKLRARFKLLAVDNVDRGVQVQWAATVEIEGQEKPACVADMVARWYR